MIVERSLYASTVIVLAGWVVGVCASLPRYHTCYLPPSPYAFYSIFSSMSFRFDFLFLVPFRLSGLLALSLFWASTRANRAV